MLSVAPLTSRTILFDVNPRSFDQEHLGERALA
jgi:hypothetical protein